MRSSSLIWISPAEYVAYYFWCFQLSLWYSFDVVLMKIRCRFDVALMTILCCFDVAFILLWGRFYKVLISFWWRVDVVSTSLWCRFYVDLMSFWNCFEAALRLILILFDVSLVSFWGCFDDVFISFWCCLLFLIKHIAPVFRMFTRREACAPHMSSGQWLSDVHMYRWTDTTQQIRLENASPGRITGGKYMSKVILR